MKKIITFAAVFAVLGTSGMAQAQSTGGQQAKFIRPITLSVWKAMNFGTFVPGVGGGTVTVVHDNASGSTQTPAGYTGSVQKAGTQGPQEQPMDFKMTGEPNMLFTLSSSNPTEITLTGPGGHTMLLNPFFPPFVIQAGNTGPAGTGIGARGVGAITVQFDATGSAWTSEGGTLNVSGRQAPGLYTASWTETISYQ